MSENAEKTVLLLDKVLLSPHPGVARGVEVFNMFLIKELVMRGYAVTVPCHREWVETIHAAGAGVNTLECSATGKPIVTGLIAACRLRKKRFDVLLLGNVANGLIPAVRWMFAAGVFARCVMMSHREPSVRFVRSLKKVQCTVLAVNGIIADHYKEAGYKNVEVFFGLPDGSDHFPAADKPVARGLKYCVVGYLDNAWKGADTAIAAFRQIPEALRRNMSLHLISYKDVPEFDEENIVPYEWMPLEKVPSLLREMDVMIVPSRDEGVMRETFCLAAVQGMLTGLPLLVSNLPVMREKVAGGGGLIFDSIEELTDSMVKLHEDRELLTELSVGARSAALDRFIWNMDEFIQRFLFPSGGSV